MLIAILKKKAQWFGLILKDFLSQITGMFSAETLLSSAVQTRHLHQLEGTVV